MPRRHKYIGSQERVPLAELEKAAEQQAENEQECVACGHYTTGQSPCKCVTTERVRRLTPDAEFLELLKSKPEACTCDWPVLPWHRWDCGVYKPVRLDRKKANEHPIYTDAVIAEEVLEAFKQSKGVIRVKKVFATPERTARLRAFLAANR